MIATNHTEIDLEWKVHGQGIGERKLDESLEVMVNNSLLNY